MARHKRIVICCDGTWNELDYKSRPVTNVVKLAQSIHPEGDAGDGADPVKQVVFYDEGVGTLEGESMDGGGFGDGLIQNIVDAYSFLVFNYDPGDEIFVFGFSRGAYTARSLVGMIRNCGILRRDAAPYVDDALMLYKDKRRKPDHPDSIEFRRTYNHPGWWIDTAADLSLQADNPDQKIMVSYLGVWDTVGQNGVPGVWNAMAGKAEDHGFHDLKLSRIVQRARHAVALDEPRAAFRPALFEASKMAALQTEAEQDGRGRDAYQQLWFPGDHGSVGGGGDVTGLSDHALAWIAEGACSNGARLSYDAEFSAVNFPVTVRDRSRSRNNTQTIRFSPSLHAPLSNVSGDWKQANQSAIGRLLGYSLGMINRDRVTHLPDVGEIAVQAKQYEGFEGENMDYVQSLADRIRQQTRIRIADIEAAFPTWRR